MTQIKQIFGIREKPTPSFSKPERQSVEQTEDYAIKKVVITKELIVETITGGGGVGTAHTPTIYRGTDFAGSNPNKTLTHSRTLPANTRVSIGGRTLVRGTALDPLNEYEISGDVITIVNIDIDNADVIVVED